MRVIEESELEAKFGLTSEQLDEMEKEASRGELRGKQVGKVEIGRPLMFGEEMRQVGFKEPIGKVEAIDRRAASLGLKRSEYLRMLVEKDLALAAAN